MWSEGLEGGDKIKWGSEGKKPPRPKEAEGTTGAVCRVRPEGW